MATDINFSSNHTVLPFTKAKFINTRHRFCWETPNRSGHRQTWRSITLFSLPHKLSAVWILRCLPLLPWTTLGEQPVTIRELLKALATQVSQNKLFEGSTWANVGQRLSGFSPHPQDQSHSYNIRPSPPSGISIFLPPYTPQSPSPTHPKSPDRNYGFLDLFWRRFSPLIFRLGRILLLLLSFNGGMNGGRRCERRNNPVVVVFLVITHVVARFPALTS